MNVNGDERRAQSLAEFKARFLTLAAKADECDALAARCAEKGNRIMKEHYEQCANDARKQACGCDYRAVHDEYWTTRERVSVALTCEEIEALEEMGIGRKRRARVLAGWLREAICAYRLARRTGVTATRLEVGPGRSHSELAYNQHMSATAAAEFAVCAATYAELPAA